MIVGKAIADVISGDFPSREVALSRLLPTYAKAEIAPILSDDIAVAASVRSLATLVVRRSVLGSIVGAVIQPATMGRVVVGCPVAGRVGERQPKSISGMTFDDDVLRPLKLSTCSPRRVNFSIGSIWTRRASFSRR